MANSGTSRVTTAPAPTIEWRPSSAPKKAAADFKISLARRSSRFSRSNSRIRARSSELNPGRWPVSTSASRTQRRSVSGVIPNLDEIEVIAAHCEPNSPSCSNTIRTARSRISRGYRVEAERDMTPILSKSGASNNPGAVHRIDEEEFYRMLDGVVIDDTDLFNDKLQEWEDFYNFNRPHGGLDGQTPYERLRQKTQSPQV